MDESPAQSDETCTVSRHAPGKREHFIPLHPEQLLGLLLRQTSLLPGEADQLQTLYERLTRVLELEARRRLSALKENYALLDPDSDLVELTESTPQEAHERTGIFFSELEELFERANYSQVPQEQIREALAQQGMSDLKLDVDLNSFARLVVYARGDTTYHCSRRRFRWLSKRRERNLAVFQRLAIAYQPKAHRRFAAMAEPQFVYLKMFKNIPRNDLELLLPGGALRMKLLDRGKIWLPTISGLGLAAWKIMHGALVLAAASLMEMAATIGLMGGMIGYAMKAYYGYRQTRERQQLALTQQLYYQNLDNNAGVLFRLVEEGCEQEIREALLGWFLLWRSPLSVGRSSRELDREGEALLREATQIDIDLEIDDALDKLARLGLASERSPDRWLAVPPSAAIRRLEMLCDDLMRGDKQRDETPEPVVRLRAA